MTSLSPEVSADILENIEDEEAADLAASLPNETLARIVDEMEPDEAADLLGDIRPEQAQAVLERLEKLEEMRLLLLHPDESVDRRVGDSHHRCLGEFIGRDTANAGDAVQD